MCFKRRRFASASGQDTLKWIVISESASVRECFSDTARTPHGDRLKVRRGTATVEDAQGTPIQSHISPSILVYEDEMDDQVETCVNS